MSRRDFLYKRSPHPAIAARFTPTYNYSPTPTSSSASAKTTSVPPLLPPPPPPPPPPVPTTSTPTTSSTTSSAPQTTSSTTPSTTSAITSTTASTTPTSSSALSSSAYSASSTSSSVVPVATSPNGTTEVVPGITYAPTTSTPTPTSTPSSSSGVSTTAIVGGVAGALVGIAVLGFLIMWCMRRQRDRDNDDFDPSAFKRQSAVLVDDPVEPMQSYNPRPPTMIERHNASPALAAQAGYAGQNFYGNYGGYNQQPHYPPPEMISHAGPPPSQPYGTYAYEPSQQLARQPSNPAYLTRQPSSVAAYGTLAPPADAHYVDLNRSSVTPFQAAQYADISNQLGAPNPDAHVVQPKAPLPLPEGLLPSPFDDAVEVTTPPVNQSATPEVQPRADATKPTQRPTSTYTVYEEDDAYGGI